MTESNVPGLRPVKLIQYYESFKAYYLNCELETKKWFVQNAKKDWNYIDAGANVGIYSILFSFLSPEGCIFAFEPTETSKILKENLNFNICQNVSIHELALGNKCGKLDEKVFKIWGMSPEPCLRPFITIDEFCKLHRVKRLDCIKIDVDSYDLDVLEGSVETLKYFNPYIVVELNHALAHRNRSNNEAFKYLAALGYDQALMLDNENFVLKKGQNFPSLKELKLKFL